MSGGSAVPTKRRRFFLSFLLSFFLFIAPPDSTDSLWSPSRNSYRRVRRGFTVFLLPNGDSPKSCPKNSRNVVEFSNIRQLPGTFREFPKSAFFFPFSVDQGSSRLRSKAFRSIPPNTSPITRALEKKNADDEDDEGQPKPNCGAILQRSRQKRKEIEHLGEMDAMDARWRPTKRQFQFEEKKTFLPIFIGFSSVFLFSILKTKVLPMVCRVFMEFSNVSSTF